MATTVVESQLELETITVSVNYTLSDQRETLVSDDYPDGHTFAYEDQVGGEIVYTRKRPHDFRRWCDTENPEKLAAELLKPGEFFINGACCCPCAGLLFPKAAKKKVAGKRVYSLLEGDTSGFEIPEEKKLTLFAAIGIDFPDCRDNMGSVWVPKGTPEKPDILIATVAEGADEPPKRNAEQVVTLQTNGTNLSGNAVLRLAVDGGPYDISLTYPVPTGATRPNIGQMVISNGIPDTVITREQNGFRVGFIGRWAHQPVTELAIHSNDLLAGTLVRGAFHFLAETSVYLPGSLVAIFSNTFLGTVAGRCVDVFSKSKALHNVDDTLDGEITVTGS